MSKKNSGLKELDKVRGQTKQRQKELKKLFFPTEYLNDEIEIIDQNLERYMLLHRHFCEYFHYQRSQRKEQIREVILNNLDKDFEENDAWRVTSYKFSQDPLCTIGSVLRPPGGRFNFGKSLEPYEKFHCLYLGSDIVTTLREKYHNPVKYDGEELSESFLNLTAEESHTNYRISYHLANVLDLRKNSFFESFLEIIKDIPDPEDLNKTAKFYGWKQEHCVRDLESLKSTVFNPDYTYSGITFGLPSNSQWIGYLCHEMGVQGILYPSVRNEKGFNTAVIVDNLKGDNYSFVKLYDDIKYISQDRREINKSNVDTFKSPEKLP